MKDPDKDEKTGYGKPPKETRFRKGQSGNPRGRRKGSCNFTADLDKILDAPMTITENGRLKKVSSQMAMLLRLREKALKGDARALDRLLGFAQQRFEDREARATERELAASEQDILARFEQDLLRRAADTLASPGSKDAQNDS
ncbi:DUF5681 domain-containing protein [Pseudohalocynthiibacter aestuariivivens]|uniref:DUF5681 domain-containing protein n=1 Tax=Pseudohalocynthiibacter aestuariivivens TaxID=1591409 RepID=A0ABV5JET3_9RHOB|nr:DUF5681 domain-containing protein [Pseudohalocynthiibacter aestuariivivens]MBS9718528.1 hypothetical protein [Pseudohalocynthiibacter aestuariivivens]